MKSFLAELKDFSALAAMILVLAAMVDATIMTWKGVMLMTFLNGIICFVVFTWDYFCRKRKMKKKRRSEK
jgi:Ca2+/Na+ antiporter